MDYCIRGDFTGAINWDLILPKRNLTNQPKLSLRKVRSEVILESYISWTNRLYRLKLVNGDYLHK